MIRGATPAVAYDTTRASGAAPTRRALSDVVTTSAAAPSLMPDAFPAVTDPSLANAGLSAPSVSAVVPARGYSSVRKVTVARPFFAGISTGTISAANRPSRIASAARRWLSAANASWSARETPQRVATSSAVMPMWHSSIAHVNPSCNIESMAVPLPRR
jgi:hypothetical protein